MESKHYKRYSGKLVKEALLDTPVVFVMGARQSGKTTLIKELTNEAWRFINLDDQTQLNLVKEDPIGFIRMLNEEHIAIDEIQRLPELLIAIKQSVDNNRMPGRFLLTGSANALVFPKVADSLAGRIETVLLSPLSECEINNTKPLFLSYLIDGQVRECKSIVDKKYLIQRIVTV